MRHTAVAVAPQDADLTVWRIVEPLRTPASASSWPRWVLPVGSACLGLLVTAVTASAVWITTAPDSIVRTRILAEGAGGPAGRAALSELMLRFAVVSNDRVTLQDRGDTLLVTAQDRTLAGAQERSRSLVDAILNTPVPLDAALPQASTEPVRPEALLRAERSRLVAAADAADARWVAVSTSLTALARDVAAASRTAADRMSGRETLDKGNAALADLQLQRLQLASKYQDTYPSVIALDVQIRSLRVFLNDEARRVESHQPASSPADALLGQERDRLRAELSQVEDRRRALAGDLGRIDQKLAALPARTPLPPQPVAPPRAVLVAAATTTALATADQRMVTVPAIVAFGFAASALCWLLGRRQSRFHGGGLVLQRIGGGLPPSDDGRALPLDLRGLALPSGSRRLMDQAEWHARSTPG